MSFCIQDPSYDKSEYLHEALVTACVGNIIGGGAYAYASKEGIVLLIEDDNFKQFLKEGSFLLIVGMDDITNIYSIEVLKNLQEKFNGHLQVKAYIHRKKGSVFHPKFSWFSNGSGGVLVLGSGNLTQKGLRQNREAYTIETCSAKKIAEIEKEWNNWIEHSKYFLFDINEDIVYQYAQQNTYRMKTIVDLQKKIGDRTDVELFCKYLQLIQRQPQNRAYSGLREKKDSTITNEPETNVIYDEDLDIDLPYWTMPLYAEALIAEIPKSGSRWQQVNFDKKTFEEFFGATCGENGSYRILFRHMEHDGILGKVEVRPSVSVSSRNYRFELDAAKGIAYPKGANRPLGVFVKISPRDFIYELFLPGDEAYNECLTLLDSKESYAVNRMRRIRYICQEVFEKVPQLALWKRLDVKEYESR